jgi:hypothetical protein
MRRDHMPAGAPGGEDEMALDAQLFRLPQVTT